MCSYIVEKTALTGSAKAAGTWTPITTAVVSVDHPSHATLDHALHRRFRQRGASGERARRVGAERRVGARTDRLHAGGAGRVRRGPLGSLTSSRQAFVPAASLTRPHTCMHACRTRQAVPRRGRSAALRGCDAVSDPPICPRLRRRYGRDADPGGAPDAQRQRVRGVRVRRAGPGALHRGKYGGDRQALVELAAMTASRLAGPRLFTPDAVVAVPLGRAPAQATWIQPG